ncbi:MAG: hypothetical protein R3C56_25870 [Pirellulaceae bacterium]
MFATPECLSQRLARRSPLLRERSEQPLPPGFSRVSGTHLDLITDLPLDDDLRELPAVFDAAMAGWCDVFEIPPANVASWRVEAYVMRDRQRFLAAGFLPKEIAHFINGFQLGDRLWVNEQPSVYYRRHLLLHEGTHWIMSRKFGGLGPPWLAEGMAEWLGTHRWDGQHLEMGVIPTNSDEVPYWGRTKTIQEQLSQGVRPFAGNDFAVQQYGPPAAGRLRLELGRRWSFSSIIPTRQPFSRNSYSSPGMVATPPIAGYLPT